ncbi:MAG: flagellar hook-associated protein FlgK [Cellvibrionaceae bacterium]|nr:flagellar hook-associated protein FlgK [Cellvibrionaceae bacterium]
MSGDPLSVSVSGLRVSQNALRTAGHNIANANTEGYSRQSTDIHSSGGSYSGVGYLGNGAYTVNVERVVDEFVVGQVRQDTSLYAELNAYNTYIRQLDDVLANQSTGLLPGLQAFFAAVQNLADDPTSVPSRQLFISESGNLSNRFNTLYSRMETIDDGVNQTLAVAVSQVNALSDTIAEVNRAIGEAYGANGTQAPNDLLDQRDQALKALSELVTINVVEQDGNQVNVTAGTGLPLVTGYSYRTIAIEQNTFDPSQPEIVFSDAAVSDPITGFFSGGEIGGLLDFQQNVMRPAFNDLGRVGMVLADNFNQLQQQGIDLNGRFGENIFLSINDTDLATGRVLPSSQNTTDDQQMALTVSDASALLTSDYRFSVDDNSNVYRVTRLSDNTDVASALVPTSFPTSISFDGLSLDISAGTFSSGDEFLLQPTRFGARDFAVQTLTTDALALGSPIVTDTAIGNLGSASISAGEVLQLVDANNQTLSTFAQAGQLSPPLLVRFTTATSYDVLDNSDPGNPVQLSPPLRNQVYVPGIENSLFSDDVGQTTVVSAGAALGLPAANTSANAYPAETFSFVTTDPTTGATSSQTAFSSLNASARTTAGLLDNLDGVSANAFTYLELRDFTVTHSVPLQVSLNGQDLVEYDAAGTSLHASVPDPAANSGEDFNDYLAAQINANSTLSALGIYAVSAYDATNSEYYIAVHSTQGDDLTVGLEAAVGEVIEVTDGSNSDRAITGAGAGTTNTLVVGGALDVSLAANVVMSTTPTTSSIFGDSSAAGFALAAYRGIQAAITGTPEAGDTFTLDYNSDAAMDNRNALAMADLEQAGTLAGNTQSYYQTYNSVIEEIGIYAHSSQMNTDAAERVLQQTTSLRDSISGVNLDEEAADLIRFEQLYAANAQVINVARELFDQLLNSL